MKSAVKQVEDCMKELKFHKLVIDVGWQESQQAYVLTSKAINAINAAQYVRAVSQSRRRDIKVKVL